MPASGTIEVEFANGSRVRITGSTDRPLVRGSDDDPCKGWAAPIVPVPSGAQVWLASGHTDMRKGV
jgi:hypothetical protein